MSDTQRITLEDLKSIFLAPKSVLEVPFDKSVFTGPKDDPTDYFECQFIAQVDLSGESIFDIVNEAAKKKTTNRQTAMNKLTPNELREIHGEAKKRGGSGLMPFRFKEAGSFTPVTRAKEMRQLASELDLDVETLKEHGIESRDDAIALLKKAMQNQK